MRILVSGGGTAGHVSPVLATVDALRSLGSDQAILFVGQRGGVEAGLADAAGLPFRGIFGGKIRRLPGAGLWANLSEWRHLFWNIRDSFMMAVGTLQALGIIMRFRPQVIFNKSGPPGFPIGFAAWLLRVPMVLHEPDVSPGLGTKVMGRWAKAIATGFPVNLYPKYLQPKLTYTGNPVQSVILQGDKARACQTYGFNPNRQIVLIVGGSQGARAINSAIVGHLPQLVSRVQVLHITGNLDAKRVGEETARLLKENKYAPVNAYQAVPLLTFKEMADAYATADLVVGRAGASTIAELAALGKPAILVPNRLAASHQQANAKAAADVGAVALSSEDSVELYNNIINLIGDESRRESLSHAIKGLNIDHAAKGIAQVIIKAGSEK